MNREKTEMAAVMTGPDDMLSEYDFASMKGGVRGKYYKSYREGHSVEIQKDDGTTSVQFFRLEDGAVMLEPDVREYFPNSEAVNRALRALIAIVPERRKSTMKRVATS